MSTGHKSAVPKAKPAKQGKKEICPLSNVARSSSSAINVIEDSGDIVLHLQDRYRNINVKYRCSSIKLRAASSYFDVLLDSGKFSEGKVAGERLQSLSAEYKTTPVPADALPVLEIQELGDLPVDDGHCTWTISQFLEILHGRCVKIHLKDRPHRLLIYALLAILADRFAAVDCVKKQVEADLAPNTTSLHSNGNSREEDLRQILLLGVILDVDLWFATHSAELICRGSKTWQDQLDEDNSAPYTVNAEALWWRLPRGMEEELQCRRACILETIGSIQGHFIQLYTSKAQQCKMYFGDSPQCDAFQLGEMIRFFSRQGLLDMRTTFTTASPGQEFTGNVNVILSQLHTCPSYQINRTHFHCGLRTRLVAILEKLYPSGQVGICLRCWNTCHDHESWLLHPSSGEWSFLSDTPTVYLDCPGHQLLKNMYTAETRNWTPQPGESDRSEGKR